MVLEEEEAAGTGDGGERRRELPTADRSQQVVHVAGEHDVVGTGALGIGRQRRDVARQVLHVEPGLARAAQRGRVLLACRLDRRRRAVDAERPAAELAGQVARIAAVPAADIEDRELRRGIRAQAGDGEAGELAGPVAPDALVGGVAPVPVQRGLRHVAGLVLAEATAARASAAIERCPSGAPLVS